MKKCSFDKVILLFFVSFFAVFGVLAGTYSGGSGTDSSPYLISTKADLLELRTATADYDKHFQMMADIDLTGEVFPTAVIAPDTDSEGYAFEGTAFTGVFDGNGHSIINLLIDTAGADNDYLGVFGYPSGSGAQIINLSVENATVNGESGSSYVGGLCGRNYSGSISNCCSTASVSGGNSVGGLCGLNSGSISVSYSTSTVSGMRDVGGLCGKNYDSIIECYSKGSASGDLSVGGMCGGNTYGNITDCYSTASVSGGDWVGGLCGNNDGGVIEDCYSIGPVSGDEYVGGLCGNNEYGIVDGCYFYFWSGPMDGRSQPLTASEMQDSVSYVDFDFAGNPADGADDTWSMIAGHLPKLSWQSDDGPFPPAYGAPTTTLVGEGTSTSPFEISSLADFQEFYSNTDLDRGHYILKADLDLTGISFTNAVIDHQFGGYFNGNGHVIQNIMIDVSDAYICNLGLFAVFSGLVSDLGIENINISGGVCAGGLCGLNFGSINACYSTGMVRGESGVGGLCGKNSGTLRESYSICSISGGNDEGTGGLCGDNSGDILECFSDGTVNGFLCVGGLCGRNFGGISSCFSTASVSAEGWLIGGLCGYNIDGSISKCYSTGEVSGDEDVGGLCGYNNDGSVISSCFWDVQTSGMITSSGGIGKTTTEMQMQSTFTSAGWDFVAEIVNGSDDIWYMDGYPALAGFRHMYGGGFGTEAVPYQIASVADLLELATNPADYDKCFIMTSDIDLDGEPFTKAVIAPNAASGTTYSGTPFSGVINGNGYVIRNVAISTTGSNESFLGLFGKLEGAEISNLGVENITITDSSNTSRYIGGLCGQNSGAFIIGCYVDSVTIQGGSYMGGFCGLNSYSGEIYDCYATGTLTEGGTAGGFCGYNYQRGLMENCFAACAITSAGTTGGFCAGVDATATSTSCYWDTDVSALATSSGGIGKTTTEMRQQSTFAGWDFGGMWYMNDYPALVNFINTNACIYSGGSGTEPNPYQIATKADLLELSANTDDYDKHFIMTADIDLAGESFTTAVIAANTNSMGYDFQGTAFSGVFDGTGHIINHLTIDTSGMDNHFLGLFGSLSGSSAQIINLGVENVTISDNASFAWCEFVGGLCGYNKSGCISNCYSIGFVSGGSRVGGLCGSNCGSIRECYSDSSVSGANYIGGLCGSNSGCISKCHSTGLAFGDNDGIVGGLCGSNSGSINECYSAGVVSGAMYIGGLCGYNDTGSITESYSVGSVNGAWYIGGLCGSNWNGSISKCYSTGAVSGDEDVGGLCGYNDTGSIISACFWDIHTLGMTTSSGGTGKTTTEMQTQLTFISSGWDFMGETANGTDDIWYMDGYPSFTTDNIANVYSGGVGTEADPYQIADMADLLELAANPDDYDKYFIMTADIDLDGFSFSRAVIAPNTVSGTTYSGTPFSGFFDGQGHIIRNVAISTTGSSESFLGLFGKLDEAEVCNLGVENITITDSSNTSRYIGGLCGQNSGALISGCYVDGITIQGGSYMGGFCGLNSYSGSITDCYSAGALNGSTYAGGFCGYNYQSGAIGNSYAACTITSAGTKGGFCAGTDATGLATGCFWDTTVSGLTASSGGAGKTTTEMQAQATYSGWEFTDIWNMDGYPALNVFGGLSFASWLNAVAVPAGLRGEGDAAVADGIPNLLKYACGLDAMTPATTADLLSISADVPGSFSILYYRSKSAVGVTLEPVWATCLSGPWQTTGVTKSLVGEDAQREQWKASVPLEESGFIKLRATAE